MHFTVEGTYQFELFNAIKGRGFDGPHFPAASVTSLMIDGEHKLSTCHTSDLLYYIISGHGNFSIGGHLHAVQTGEAVLVPRETEYGYWGQMQALLVMTPAYTEGCETRTDKSPRP